MSIRVTKRESFDSSSPVYASMVGIAQSAVVVIPKAVDIADPPLLLFTFVKVLL